MTYFLNEKPALPTNTIVPDIDPTSFLEGLGAAFQKTALENDANFRVSREKSVEYRDMSVQAGNRIGVQTLYDEGVKRGLFKSASEGNRAPPKTVEEALQQDWRAGKLVLDLAREQAAANPDAWSDLDLSDEGVDQRVNTRLQAEHRDLTQTLEAMPNGRGMAELVGGMAGVTADVKNVPFLFMGAGPGSLLKVFAREALANVAAEGANMPSQFSMAERLDIPDPDVLSQLSLAAVAGGVLGVSGELLGRGLAYFIGRNAVTAPAGKSQTQYEMEVEVAEDAIFRGENPLDAVQRVMDDFDDPRTFPEPREPLIPRSVTATTPEPTPLAPDPITTEVLPPRAGEAPQTNGELAAMAETVLNDAVKRDNKPFLRALKRGPGIDPNGEIAKELKAMGVNARSYPGLFKKGGAKDLDNLVATEWDESIPGLSRVTGMSPDGMYLDRNGVIQAIIDEAQGIRLQTDAEMAARSAEYVPKTTTAIEDFTSGARADDGFYMEPDPFGEKFSDREYSRRLVEARQGLGDYTFRKGIRDMLPNEMEEIARELALYGGDAKFLIERAIGREIDEIKRALEAPDGTARATGGEDRGGQRPAEEPAPASGAAGSAGDGAVQPQGTERTDAGIQYVAPGIAPISDRARLEAQQSRPMRGGDRAMDVGLFDAASRAQMDMFSDPIDPKARPMQDAMMEDLRDTIERDGDFTVDLMDGRGERPVSSLLNELEQDDEFNAILDACGKRSPSTSGGQ